MLAENPPLPALTPEQAAYYLWSSGGFGAYGVRGDSRKNPKPPQAMVEQLAIAVAVGMAESGLVPNAEHHNNDGTYDDGFMQINSIHQKELGMTSQQLWDPQNNASAAGSVSTNFNTKPVSFLPWTTYKTGKHFLYMPRARIAARKVLTGNVIQGGAGEPPLQGGFTHPGEFATGTADFLKGILPWDQLLRLLYILGGAVLAFMALRLLANEFGAGIGKVKPMGGFK